MMECSVCHTMCCHAINAQVYSWNLSEYTREWVRREKMNDMEDALFRYAMAVCRRLGGSVKSQDKGVASINLAQAALKMRWNNMDDALLENPTDLWNLFA